MSQDLESEHYYYYYYSVDAQAVPAFWPFALPSQPPLAGLAASPSRIVSQS